MAGDLNARSPWEHIGGVIAMAGLILLFYDLGLGLLLSAIGAVCIGLGWRDHVAAREGKGNGDRESQ